MARIDVHDLEKGGGIQPIESDKKDDLFFVCASFEDRTMFVSKNLADGYQAKRSVVYVNREFLTGSASDKTKTNLYKLVSLVSRFSEDVNVIEGSWLSPAEKLNELREIVETASKATDSRFSSLVDCTTFNRETLLTLLLLLRQSQPDGLFRVAYVSPEKHGKWLSSGFRKIRNVIGFSGLALSSRPTILVALSGFEATRTERIIEEHEPSQVLLGIGDPPTSTVFLNRNIDEQKLVLSRQQLVEFRFPADSISGTVQALKDACQPFITDSNVVLAPMSTKLSTVGVFLFAEEFSDAQITYCVPGQYNTKDYSNGVRALYLETLPSIEATLTN